MDSDGKLSPGSNCTQGKPEVGYYDLLTIKDINHSLLNHPIETIKFKIPLKGTLIGLIFAKFNFHNLPYITKYQPNSNYGKTVPVRLHHTVWILAIGDSDPITPHQVLEYLRNSQVKDKSTDITIVISNRDEEEHDRIIIGKKWAIFDQMRMVTFKVLDSDTINTDLEIIQKSKDYDHIW